MLRGDLRPRAGAAGNNGVARLRPLGLCTEGEGMLPAPEHCLVSVLVGSGAGREREGFQKDGVNLTNFSTHTSSTAAPQK